jgi:hypothetical protein
MSATTIAQVTAAIKGLLKANLTSTVSVTLLQPSDNLTNNSLNLYLYRVAEIPQLKNTDWPGDRKHGPANVPALSLDLYYLLTPFADPPGSGQDDLPPAHQLLGQAMQILYEYPVLNDVHTVGFDFDRFPGINDLRDAFDKITVRLHPVSVDEISKIWSMFNQPYRLSVVYQVSLVQIAPTAPARRPAPPVMVTGLDVFPLDPPRLAALDPPQGGASGTLTLRGFGLARQGFISSVRFGGQPVEPSSVAANQLQILLPARLEAGPEQEVRVVLDGQQSNPLTYLVSPWLRRLQPLRGAPGPAPAQAVEVSLEVEGENLQEPGISIQVTLNGTALPHTLVDNRHLRVTVPNAFDNGAHPMRVSVDGRVSNSRDFEVIPFLQSVNPSAASVGNPLQIDGQRLKGSRVRVDFGPAVFDVGANADANRVQVQQVPRLDPGSYQIRVFVDGCGSNALPFTIV